VRPKSEVGIFFNLAQTSSSRSNILYLIFKYHRLQKFKKLIFLAKKSAEGRETSSLTSVKTGVTPVAFAALNPIHICVFILPYKYKYILCTDSAGAKGVSSTGGGHRSIPSQQV